MLNLFNELMDCFSMMVSMFFNDLEFVSGLSVGWIILAITVLGMTIRFLYGRMH